jgi:hypothetical protein
LSDSSGSFRKTRVRPFCLEKTSIMKADNLISDRVICRGIVSPDAAAKGWGDVKDGFENKYVFKGFACGVDILAFCYDVDPI